MGAGSGAGQAFGRESASAPVTGKPMKVMFLRFCECASTLGHFSGLGPQAVLSGSKGNGEQPLAPWRGSA